jgi:methionyl-tRNA formyltransferase
LHVHGGYLPDYKGSTTNYYSIILDNECGASSIFMNREIDSGPIIIRRKFPPPDDRSQLDYVYDPIIRAKVLLETIRAYLKWGAEWKYDQQNNEGGETYFVMHPLLRHIAILGQ